ncbi:MAG: hypothetical protein QHI48_10880 [Bacteroidota bacterium]|nr:hypothetical protein [Bacteroidota bacterium]
MKPSSFRGAFSLGDINGFFGLMFDNLTVLSFLAGILVYGFGFPADIVFTRMFPGTALGVLFGDLVYSWMALRLARRTGRRDVTAMPLGLDTPSTIGIALTILGPAFVSMKNAGLPAHDAAVVAWQVGTASMIVIGIVKLGLSFAGGWVRRAVPQAGLLGSLAGIGLALIGAVPLIDIFGMPVVGLIALGIVLATLAAGIRLPGNVPGVFAAVVIGSVLYYTLGPAGLTGGGVFSWPSADFRGGLPLPTLGFIDGFVPALKYLPLAVPFAVLTVAGGINTTESARAAGDEYRTRDILLTEALTTLLAGFTGGVAQTTPYIGHPAYKRMGARAGYTILTGLFIGVGGMVGAVSFFVELIPRAALAPILVFVALDIMTQAYAVCPRRHAWAVGFAFFPSVMRLLAIKLGDTAYVAQETFQRLLNLPGKALPELLTVVALGNGFILTAMLWGAFLAETIERRLHMSALYLLVLAVFSLFGIVHSSSPDGGMYLPWTLEGLARSVPYQWATAYAALAALFLLLSFTRGVVPRPHEHIGG